MSRPMTVAELIGRLAVMPSNADVFVRVGEQLVPAVPPVAEEAGGVVLVAQVSS